MSGYYWVSAVVQIVFCSLLYNFNRRSGRALATSAGMTIVTTWDNFYSYRRRWIQNNDTLMKLYELNSDIKYKKNLTDSNLNTEEVNYFYNKYADILRTANESWKDDRSTEPKHD